MASPTAAAVQELLGALLSPDNAVRAQAEGRYNALLASAGVGEVAEALLEAVATTQAGPESGAVRYVSVCFCVECVCMNGSGSY